MTDTTPEWAAENLQELVDLYPKRLTISVLRSSIVALLAERKRAEAFRRAAFGVRLTHSAVRELIDPEIITPERVRAYLVANGWECRKERWDSSDWGKYEAGPVHLLNETDNDDYVRETAYIVEEAAAVEGVGELQVLDEIGRAKAVSGGNDIHERLHAAMMSTIDAYWAAERRLARRRRVTAADAGELRLDGANEQYEESRGSD